MFVDIAATLHSSKSWLYLILIRTCERTLLLILEGMGRWGIQMRGHLGRVRVGREWGYSCLWVAVKGQGALLCGEGSTRSTVVGQQGWVQGKERTRGSPHDIPPSPFLGTFNQTWICVQDLLPQGVSILSHMTTSFYPRCQHILSSVEHTRYALGSFPT